MEHVVFYPALDGSPAFRRFGNLEDAVRFVEHLRNAEGVSEVSVHALSPVPLAFRAYYKVEVPQEPVGEAAPAIDVPAPSEPVLESVPEPAEAAPVAEPVLAEATIGAPEPSPNGKRSLGFFAH
jgi:hypothetical protein